MGEGLIVRNFGGSVKALAPTINFISKSSNFITVTFTNNDLSTATIAYRISSPTENGESISLAGNSTSSNITFSELDDETENTIFVSANVEGKVKSDVTSTSITTDGPIYTAATGGTTLEYDDDGKRYKSHTFTSNGTFEVTNVGNSDRNQVDYLIIAGGAGGGGAGNVNQAAGGGGAGGYRTTLGTSGRNSSAESKVTVTATSYGVTIGGGGGGGSFSSPGAFGVDSAVNFDLLITSNRGGGGGTGGNIAGSGGSGGGSGGFPTNFATATGIGIGAFGQGFQGGHNSSNPSGGGGGGAGQQGLNASAGNGGKGGNGLANTLRDNTSETRAGGGGGGAQTPGLGGNGGGGTGSDGSNNGFPGTVNSGSGGGGARRSGTNRSGGSGGSGLVVIRYEIETV